MAVPGSTGTKTYNYGNDDNLVLKEDPVVDAEYVQPAEKTLARFGSDI